MNIRPLIFLLSFVHLTLAVPASAGTKTPGTQEAPGEATAAPEKEPKLEKPKVEPPEERKEEHKTESRHALVRKLDDAGTLWVGEKGGVHFVMERMDDAVPDGRKRRAFWSTYLSQEENENYVKYRQAWADGELVGKANFLQFPSLDASLKAGIHSLNSSLASFHAHSELWIAFVTRRPISEPSQLGELTGHDIEMYVSVCTDPASPVVMHMGISRAFLYMLNALREQSHFPMQQSHFPMHKNLAVQLHAFAASVTLQRYPKKLYMVSAPVPVMSDILLRALPGHMFIDKTAKLLDELARKEEAPATPEYKILLAKEMALEEKVQAESAKLGALDEQLWELEHKNPVPQERLSEVKEQREEIRASLKPIRAELRTVEREIRESEARMQTKIALSAVETLPVGRADAPLRIVTGVSIQVFDKSRTHVIFDFNKDTRLAKVYDDLLRGEVTRRFDWLFHGDMCIRLNPNIAVDLDALAHKFD
jgi:hypothetical protein